MLEPQAVARQLADIGRDLASIQNEYAQAAHDWHVAKREKEHDYAVEFMKAEGTDGQRRALATRETALKGMEEEAEYVALKAKVEVLKTRVGIGQSLLRDMRAEANL